MNESERKILRKCHCELVENIDPRELRSFLYSKGVLPNPTFLDDVEGRTRRTEQFLQYIVDKCTFSLFLESLSAGGFDYLADKLLDEWENTNEDNSTAEHVYRERKEPLFTSKRAKTVLFRHKLKRYSMSGKTKEFLAECDKVSSKWNAIPREEKFSSNNTELADMYYMVLDAKAERRRILFDKTLYKDEELFDNMLGITPYTSSANLPVVMYLVRYGSALLMAGKPLNDALSHLEQAKQRLQTVPACLESGIVLYIEFNMLLSDKYEKAPSAEMKNQLLKIGKASIDHCCREQDEVGKDIHRMMLIKQALLLLGIGLFLNNADNVIITKEDREQAEKMLKEIENPEHWERMEARWKVRYHVAQSKLFALKGRMPESLAEAQLAAEFANVGNSKDEIANVEERVSSLSERKTPSFE